MGIRSIERAMQVLQELNLQPYSSIARLHQTTGLPKPTLVRILKTLEERGFAENDPRMGGYQVTALVSTLSSGFHKEPMMVEAGRAWAIAMTRQHKWPVSIALLDHNAMAVRFSTVPDSPISPFHNTVNMRLALLTRALGLAYIAFAPKEESDLIIETLRQSDEPENRLSHEPQTLTRLFAKVRKDGYATRAMHVEPRNSNTIAVPIFGDGGRVAASLGLTYFVSSFKSQADACDRYVPVLKTAAQKISEDLARLSETLR